MPNPDGTLTPQELEAMFGKNGSLVSNPAGGAPAPGVYNPNGGTPTSRNPYASAPRVGGENSGYVGPADRWGIQQATNGYLGSSYKPLPGADQYGTTVGLAGADQRERDLWANATGGLKPWLSRGEAAADTRNNFAYGGSPAGAQEFNQRLDGSNQYLTGKFSDVQGNALGLQQGAQAAQQAAQGANPYAFVDPNAMKFSGLDRGLQEGAYNQLRDFANQGPGPSAAQGQLNLATDANMMNSLALARSGRGMGGSQAGLRQAIGQNATTGQQAANQSSMLMAQENQAYQQQRLGAMQGMGALGGQMRQGDIQQGSYLSGTAQAAQNAANQTALGYGQQALGAGQLGLGSLQGNAQSRLGFAGLQNDVNKANLNGGQNYEQNLQNVYLQRQLQASQNATGTDYSPYIAAGAAGLASMVGGPGAGAAAYGGVSAVGSAVKDSGT